MPRPNKNTACNTVFVVSCDEKSFSIFIPECFNFVYQNNQLTGVVVISNDNITPFDVTTKDDLFYQVTCDYGSTSEGSIFVSSGGFIVG